MRKIFLAIAALSALLAVSCTVEPVLTEDPDTLTTFSAAFDGDDATRTVRQSTGKVWWNPGDQLSVFIEKGEGGGACFTSTNTDPKARVDFVGNLSRPTTSYYYAYYPYSTSVSFNGTAFQASLPSEQEAEEGGTFADDLFVSMGRTRTSSMSFYHLTGGVKFTVTERNIKSVTLIGLHGEPVAGEFVADLGDDFASPTVREVVDGSETVTLSAPFGSTLAPGTAYHMVTLPVTFKDGFQLIFEKEDGSIGVKTVAKTVAIQRAHFAVLDEADKNLTWEKEYFDLSPLDIEIPSYTTEIKLYVRSSEEPHIDIFDSWITFVRKEGDCRSGAYYYYRAERNTTSEEREGYISVCANSLCKIATIIQAPYVEGDWMNADFAHHSFGMRFTATWCGYCPMMNEAFKMVREEMGDKFLYACFYSSSRGGLYAFPDRDLATLETLYQVSGYPTGIVDGRSDINNYSQISVTAQRIKDAINETEANYPTVTGLSLNSSLNGNELTVEVSVFTKVSDDYKLTVLLLENNIIGTQTDYNANVTYTDFVHNKVARVPLTTVTGDAFRGTEGKEQKFTFTCTVPAEYRKENLEIAAYVQRPFGTQTVISSADFGGYYVDNSRSAAVGAFADIELQ